MSARDEDGGPRVTHVQGQGIQVGDGGRQYNQFGGTYIEKQVIQSAGPEPAQIVVGDIPQAPPAFQPREDLLSALGAASPGASIVTAVTGMRGVGKTQLAAAYARQRVNEGWRLIAWVNAETMHEARAGLWLVAQALGIETSQVSIEDVGRRVRGRVEAADDPRSLLVFDNVTDISALRPYVPAAGKAQVVLTSTSEGTANLGTPVAVDVFTEEEALAFLAERTHADEAGARELARELGYLPLALSQAAAVIDAQRLTSPVYLDRLRKFPLARYLPQADGDPYPRGLAESILLSVESVTGADPTGLCGPLLDTIALLSPAGVPRDLARTAGQAGLLDRAGPAASADVLEPDVHEAGVDEAEVDEAIGRLAGASLLAFGGENHSTVTAHRLVMRVTRERRAADGALVPIAAKVTRLLERSRQSIDAAWRDPAAARDFVQQVTALSEHVTGYLREQDRALAEELFTLRGWAQVYLHDLGNSHAQAIEVGQALVADCARLLGDADIPALAARNNLAQAYREAGRFDESIALFEQVMVISAREWGDTHASTLTARHNLAGAYQAAGRLDEAIALYEDVVAASVRTLGRADSRTLASRAALAGAYAAAGRTQQGVNLLLDTLVARQRAQGAGHPDTLMTLADLAGLFRQTGHLYQAVRDYREAVDGLTTALGAGHPSTVLVRGKLTSAEQDWQEERRRRAREAGEHPAGE